MAELLPYLIFLACVVSKPERRALKLPPKMGHQCFLLKPVSHLVRARHSAGLPAVVEHGALGGQISIPPGCCASNVGPRATSLPHHCTLSPGPTRVNTTAPLPLHAAAAPPEVAARPRLPPLLRFLFNTDTLLLLCPPQCELGHVNCLVVNGLRLASVVLDMCPRHSIPTSVRESRRSRQVHDQYRSILLANGDTWGFEVHFNPRHHSRGDSQQDDDSHLLPHQVKDRRMLTKPLLLEMDSSIWPTSPIGVPWEKRGVLMSRSSTAAVWSRAHTPSHLASIPTLVSFYSLQYTLHPSLKTTSHRRTSFRLHQK